MTDLILIKGAGDLATGVGYRLFRAGFRVVMTELAVPLCVRRTVAFAEAVILGQCTVEEVTAVRADTPAAVAAAHAQGLIPVAVDPEARLVPALAPHGVVDATLTKRRPLTQRSDAPVVVGLGPGFTAGLNCHAVVETHRGHLLGRAYYQGSALPDTGVPGPVGGVTAARVLRAPAAGIFTGRVSIGDRVAAGALVGEVRSSDGSSQPVYAAIGGVVRGLLRDGARVHARLKVGDVDPTAEASRCYTISDKALAVAGGVLEALLHLGCRPAPSP